MPSSRGQRLTDGSLFLLAVPAALWLLVLLAARGYILELSQSRSTRTASKS